MLDVRLAEGQHDARAVSRWRNRHACAAAITDWVSYVGSRGMERHSLTLGRVGYHLLLAAWGIIASFVSLYVGYRRYVQQDDEREKRCHHALDVDEQNILLEALNIAQNALRKGAELPSRYKITSEKLDAVYHLVFWADGLS